MLCRCVPSYECICTQAHTHTHTCTLYKGKTFINQKYNKGIPLEDRVRRMFLTFFEPPPDNNTLMIRRLANLDFTNRTEACIDLARERERKV